MRQEILSLITELEKEAQDVLKAVSILRDAARRESNYPQRAGRRAEAVEVNGLTLGEIPVKRLSATALAKSRSRMGTKRKYTKRSKFWAKPHPRKKK